MSTEVRCRGTRERPHAPHTLAVAQSENPADSIRVLITAPQCSVACRCCQAAGSSDFAVASLFRPGVAGAFD